MVGLLPFVVIKREGDSLGEETLLKEVRLGDVKCCKGDVEVGVPCSCFGSASGPSAALRRGI